MEKIRWGIIGCGDVTEVKSGPAFNKVKNSELVAVMRRNEEKVKDYAARHNVPKWYTDAEDIIDDPDVNAIYIATPPSSHEEYTIAAVEAGKPIYVEKPMSVNAKSADNMAHAAAENHIKLSVAHYRRAQPLFKKIKQLVDEKAIGDIRFVRSDVYRRLLSKEELANPAMAWRVNTSIAGGGLFHDISPHQLDLMYYFFGQPSKVSGISLNQAGVYKADEMVAGNILFKNKILFSGIWNCNTTGVEEKDRCEIIGDYGKIEFSFFEHKPLEVTIKGIKETIVFDPLRHVQQPMIDEVVRYFLDEGPNPCSGEEGVEVMRLIDQFSGKP